MLRIACLVVTWLVLSGCYARNEDVQQLTAERKVELIEIAEDTISKKMPGITLTDLRFEDINYESDPDGRRTLLVTFMMTNTLRIYHSDKEVTIQYRTIDVRFYSHLGVDPSHGFISFGDVSRSVLSDPIKFRNAVLFGDGEELQRLLSLGVDVNMLDDQLMTPLHHAILREHQEIVLLLLNAGADLHARNVRGDTPLIMASSVGDKYIVNALIARGAQVTEQNVNGISPLIAATIYNHFGVVDLLLRKGADPNARDKDGDTALDWAVAKSYTNIVLILKRSSE